MAHRVILFRTEHTTRTFVDQVDFIRAPGRTPAGVYREGGPTLVVTLKAVLTWDRDAKEWMLEATHPCFFIEGGKVKYRILLKKLALLESNPRRPRTPCVEDGGRGRMDAHLSCLRPEENSLRLILKLRKILFSANQLSDSLRTFSRLSK